MVAHTLPTSVVVPIWQNFAKPQQPKPLAPITNQLPLNIPSLISKTPLPSSKPTSLHTPQITTKTYAAVTKAEPGINIPQILINKINKPLDSHNQKPRPQGHPLNHHQIVSYHTFIFLKFYTGTLTG